MAQLAPEAYLRPDVIQRVQRFDLKAKFLVEGFLAGLHSSPYKGFSVEFSEHRKYARGDDVRLVDWKLWSRTNRYYVKQYEAETNLTGMLVVDVSASMSYAGPGQAMSKLQYATHLAAALAYMMLRQQDPVGLVTCGENVEKFLPPRSKPSHLYAMLNVLAGTKPSGATKLAESLHRVAEMLSHRGMVILFSDLLDGNDSSADQRLLDALAHLRFRGHDLIVFHVMDSAETRFGFNGPSRFEDLEGSAAVLADPAAVRDGYLAALERFRAFFRTECHKRRIDLVPVDTSVPFDKPLLAYLQKRAGMGV